MTIQNVKNGFEGMQRVPRGTDALAHTSRAWLGGRRGSPVGSRRALLFSCPSGTLPRTRGALIPSDSQEKI